MLFVFMLIMPVMVNAAPSESPIHSHLSEVEVEDRNKTPQETTTDTAVPPPGVQLPGNEAGNGNQQGGNADSSGSGNHESNQEGNSQNGNAQDGNNSSNMTPATPVPTDGVSVPSTGTVQTPGSNGTSTSTIDPNGVQTNPTDTSAVDTGKGDQQGNEQQDNRPWYEKLWDKAKDVVAHPVESLANFGKGAAAGLIGAAAVVIVVAVVGALILSAPISVPVLITALVVGAVVGGIYGLVAGDNFSFIAGIGYGALAAISVIGIAQSGIVAAFRGGVTLFRNQGLKALVTQLGRGGLNYFKGLAQGAVNGFRSLITAPIQTIKSAVFSARFYQAFSVNFAVSGASKLILDQQYPSIQDMGMMALESVAGALIFDKVADVIKAPAVSKFGQSIAGFFSGMVESISMTSIKAAINKKDDKSLEQQAAGEFFKSMFVAPLFGNIMRGIRDKNGISTSFSDLSDRGINVSSSDIGQKSITNRQLNLLWNRSGNEQTVERWAQNGPSLTQRQYDDLLGNQERLDFHDRYLKPGEKLTGEVTNKIPDWIDSQQTEANKAKK
ncbi:hypothetical protein [Paenibacillus kandeliae]|uniref:hypothetical protein n=1 Tax=Paenibacillus kandeliae TaxID=3231269 RepID=UPI0034579D00